MLYQPISFRTISSGRCAFATGTTMARSGDELGGMRLARRWDAALEMVQRYRLTATRPDFHPPVPIGNREVPIGEEVVAEFPFGRLPHFAMTSRPQPKLLVPRRCRATTRPLRRRSRRFARP